MANPRNNRSDGVTKFCLAMEEHRRTEVGRVRTAKEFVGCFFTYDPSQAKDQLFVHMPNEVRGPILSTWGIRGAKAALRDDDLKVKEVVHDALVAGDIDEGTFEEGVGAPTLIDWIPLTAWWNFWRKGKLTGVAIQKALATARELSLIDDRWFLLNIEGRGGKLKGTDVICDTLSKDQIVAWIRRLHESGDGSPAGIVSALGWETILAKTAQDALLFALDAFARKAGLVPDLEPVSLEPVSTESPSLKTAAPPVDEAPPTPHVNGDSNGSNGNGTNGHTKHDSGFPISVPDIPAVDMSSPEPPPSVPIIEEAPSWAGTAVADESPKLAEARAKMMQMLEQGREPAPSKWDESEVPAKPSSLEWPEPPPISAQLIEEPTPGPSKAAPPPLPRKGPSPSPKR